MAPGFSSVRPRHTTRKATHTHWTLRHLSFPPNKISPLHISDCWCRALRYFSTAIVFIHTLYTYIDRVQIYWSQRDTGGGESLLPLMSLLAIRSCVSRPNFSLVLPGLAQVCRDFSYRENFPGGLGLAPVA